MCCYSHLLLACVSLRALKRICDHIRPVHVYILKPDDSCSQEPKVQKSLPCCHNGSLPVSNASPHNYHMTAEGYSADTQTQFFTVYGYVAFSNVLTINLSHSARSIAVVLL